MILKFIKAVSTVMRIGPDKIERLEREVKRLEREATTDPLTGLLNRRGFEDQLKIEKKRSDRYGHRFLAVYIDIDNLKAINDLQGHDHGDKMIISVTEMIKRNCRSTDFAARVGGDEFIIIFTETGEDEAEAIVERLRSEADNISIGYCQYHGDAIPMDGVMRIAETRMREDKKKKRCKVKGRDD